MATSCVGADTTCDGMNPCCSLCCSLCCFNWFGYAGAKMDTNENHPRHLDDSKRILVAAEGSSHVAISRCQREFINCPERARLIMHTDSLMEMFNYQL